MSGRPTDYCDEIVEKARQYVLSAEDEDINQLAGLTQKGTELFKSRIKVNLPSIEGLSLHLGISRETVYDWESQESKKVFSDIIMKLRAKQAIQLINKGLSGEYNSTIVKVLLSKHGYREGVEQTGKDGAELHEKLTPEQKQKLDTILSGL